MSRTVTGYSSAFNIERRSDKKCFEKFIFGYRFPQKTFRKEYRISFLGKQDRLFEGYAFPVQYLRMRFDG